MITYFKSFFGKTAVAALGMSGLFNSKKLRAERDALRYKAAGCRKEKEMKSANCQAYLEQFPWLQKYIECYKSTLGTTKFLVQRMDESILEKRPWWWKPRSWHDEYHYGYIRRYYFIISETGKQLVEVGMLHWWYTFCASADNQWNYQSVGEALFEYKQAGLQDQPHFILEIMRTDLRNNWPSSLEITIFKPPKNSLCLDWLEACKQRDEKEIQEK